MSAILAESLYRVERIDGREVEKPMPKKLHAIIQAYLIAALSANLLKRKYQVLSELNVLCGAEHRDRVIPDVTVALRTAEYREGDLFDPALFCVEILSPGQSFSSLLDKAERLLQGGTPVCWIIWPERRQAWVYRKDDLHEAAAALKPELPDGDSVEIATAEMWAELE